MAVDLTEKYTKKVWKRNGEVLNPNFAMLLNEIENYDIFVLQGGTRCFAPNQLVFTKKGSKPISEIQQGDLVRTFNERTKELEWKPVKEVLSFNNHKPTIHIKLKNGKEIIVSADHEFYVNGRWMSVYYYLFRNEQTLNPLGLEINDISEWDTIVIEDCPIVYDISIADNHNYFLDCGKPILVHNSGKTYATLQFIWMNMVQASGVKYSIVRKSMPLLKGTVIPDFVEIGQEGGLYRVSDHNQTEQKFKHEGNDLWFFSGEDEEKLRGRKQHFLYLNEAPELEWESVKQLLFRTTGKIVLDYNPSYPDSWVYDNILTRDNVAFLRTTYKNNPHLSERQLDELEWMRINDPQGYLVYGLGERGEIQGQVYNHFKRIHDKQFPKHAEIFSLDFGFSDHPTAIIRGAIEGRTIYVKELVYESGLSNEEIIIHLFFNGYDEEKGHILIADSANPKDISDLRYGHPLEQEYINEKVAAMGYRYKSSAQMEKLKKMLDNGIVVVGAIKGQGSVRSGIKAVRSMEVLMTEGSTSGWKEIVKYKYKIDKWTGKYTLEPIKEHDHIMDCIRYMALGNGRQFNIR